jgi:tetratricopeptide (TPR) repeat protein
MPFVLLLLDMWPLKRVAIGDFRPAVWKPLLFEKQAFFLLTAAACVITYLVEQHGHAVQSAQHFPLAGRIENAFVSYARYLAKAFWPVNLTVYYPYPEHLPLTESFLAATFVVLVSAAAVSFGRTFPYLLMGWFWFLGTLVPVIGLVQAGTQAMADRYAYLSLIGIFIAFAWGVSEMLQRLKLPQAVLFLASGIVLLASTVVARHQLNYWQNDGVLFSHALAVAKDNAVAETTLGVYLDQMDKPEEAVKRYRRAVTLDPTDKTAHYDLGVDLDNTGQPEASIKEYRAALQFDPTYLPAAYNLALLLERQGRRDEAIAEFKKVLQIKPDFSPAKQHLQALGVN